MGLFDRLFGKKPEKAKKSNKSEKSEPVPSIPKALVVRTLAQANAVLKGMDVRRHTSEILTVLDQVLTLSRAAPGEKSCSLLVNRDGTVAAIVDGDGFGSPERKHWEESGQFGPSNPRGFSFGYTEDARDSADFGMGYFQRSVRNFLG